MASNRLSIRKNFTWMFAGRIIYAACQWLVLIFIARFASPGALGEFTYALAITSPIIILAQLNMRSFMITDAINQFEFRDYFTTQIITLSIAIIAVAAIATASNLAITGAFILISVGFYKAIEAISGVYYGILQKKENMKFIGISVALHGVSALIVIIISLKVFSSVIYGVVGVVIVWLSILLAFDAPSSAPYKFSKQFCFNNVLKVVTTCFPLGLVLALVSLRINVPVYFIKADLGIEQVGQYSVVAYFIVASGLLIGTLVQVSAPRFSKYYHLNNCQGYIDLLKKMLSISFLIGLLGVAVAWLFGGEILSLLYGQSFEKLHDVLVYVMLAALVGFLSQFLGINLTVARLFKYQLLSNFCGIVVSCIACYYLVPNMGIIGAAMGMLIGVSITFVFNLFYLFTRVVEFKAFYSSAKNISFESNKADK